MNTTINLMCNRMSVRNFDPTKTIEPEVLNTILKATQQSPTSINGQQYSIIVVNNVDQRKKISDAILSSTGASMSFIHEAPIFLLFVIDFHKIDAALKYEHQQMMIQESIESLLTGSVDIGIAVGSANIAARSLGVESVVVGAIRKSIPMLIEEFQLPKYIFPLLGMALGYPTKELIIEKTPRLSLESLVHYNIYEKKDLVAQLTDYNTVMQKVFWEKRGIHMTWTEYIAKSYANSYGKEITELYRKQGFNI
ncbi:MAG: nitroreductase family protein [Brevinema sp.]